MQTSANSANSRTSRPQKHKAACDQCNTSKVKCPGGGPPCTRCANTSQPCHYSLARRIGKPPGTKNRKTLERLRQSGEEDLEVCSSGKKSDGLIAEANGGGDNRDVVLVVSHDHHHQANDLDSQLRMSDNAGFWPLSPLINDLSLPDVPSFALPLGPNISNADRDMYAVGVEESASRRGDPQLPDFENSTGAGVQEPWADGLNDKWDSSSPSINQQFSSGEGSTESPMSVYSHPSGSGVDKPISLDSVAIRLEKKAQSVILPPDYQPTNLCQCLRRYTDVLCKLQIIEKRQSPIQTDTMLTCANLVLTTAEDQFKCNLCFSNPCVALQLVMIFKTLYTWSQGQLHASADPELDISATLGQHEMTKGEIRFVRVALVSRSLDKISAMLKLLIPRIKRAALDVQDTQRWEHDGGEFWNLEQLVNSLLQSIGLLSKRLALAQSRNRT